MKSNINTMEPTTAKRPRASKKSSEKLSTTSATGRTTRAAKSALQQQQATALPPVASQIDLMNELPSGTTQKPRTIVETNADNFEKARGRRDDQASARSHRDDQAPARGHREDEAALRDQPCGQARGQRDDLARGRRDHQEDEAQLRARPAAEAQGGPRHKSRIISELIIPASTTSEVDSAEFEIGPTADGFEPRAASSGINAEMQPSTSATYAVSECNSRNVQTMHEDPITRLANALHTTLVNFRDTSLGENNSRLVNRLTSAKSLPSFSGDAFEWLHFKETFDLTSELGGYSDHENVARLFSALRGEARDSVSTMLATNQNARSIMNTLELHYGNKKLLAHRIVSEIKNLPEIESGKIKMTLFASKLKGAVGALRSCNLIGYLYSPELIKCVGSKLPSALKYAYNSYATKNDSSDKTDLEKLTDFLYCEAERSVKSGIFDEEVEVAPRKVHVTERRQQPLARPARVYTTAHCDARERTSDPRADLCVICNRNNHMPANCASFARESLERRWFLVNKFRLCYKCLNQGHTKAECRGRNCAQCTRPHHALLHNPIRSKNENNKNLIQNRERSIQATVAQATNANAIAKPTA